MFKDKNHIQVLEQEDQVMEAKLVKKTENFKSEAEFVKYRHDFNLRAAKALVLSENEFPVDLEELLYWLDDSITDINQAKRGAKSSLIKTGFLEGQDFKVSCLNTRNLNKAGGRIPYKVHLTIECAKHYAMMSKRKNGRLVRQFFIEAEEELKEIKSGAIASATSEITLMHVSSLITKSIETTIVELDKHFNKSFDVHSRQIEQTKLSVRNHQFAIDDIHNEMDKLKSTVKSILPKPEGYISFNEWKNNNNYYFVKPKDPNKKAINKVLINQVKKAAGKQCYIDKNRDRPVSYYPEEIFDKQLELIITSLGLSKKQSNQK